MRTILLSIILLFITLIASRADDISKPDVIHIATEEYAPFTSENLKRYGIFNHIVSEAFRLEGIEVEYQFFPGARSFHLAKDGALDGTTPWAKRKGREIDFFYSDPILDVGGEYFFYRKNYKFNWNPATQDYSHLKGVNVGAIASYDYGSKFKEAERQEVFRVYRVSSLKRLFVMLLNGRIDVVISKEWVARHALQVNFSSEQIAQIASRPENNEPPSYDYVLLSKKRPAAQYLLKSLNKGLKKLRASGKYDAFLKAFENGDYILPQKVN
jgi:polar amino acid transport system substrate-binding protein